MFPGVIALLVPLQAHGRANVSDIKLTGKTTRWFENE